MTENSPEETKTATQRRAVRLVWIMVSITVVASLLYAVQYYLGGPIRLSVVSQIYDLAVDPNNSLVAVGTDDARVRMWRIPAQINTSLPADFDVSAETTWPTRTMTGHDGPVVCVGFTPDGGRLLSVGGDGAVWSWDTADGQGQRLLNVGRPLIDADLDAAGTTLAALDEDGGLHLWDLAAGQELHTIPPGEADRLTVALSGRGTLVAAGDGPNVEIWDVQSGQTVQRLDGYREVGGTLERWMGHEKNVTALAFDPNDELLATGSADTTIIFWDLASGQVAWSSEGHWATVTTMVFDETGNSLLSGGKDNKIRNLRLPGGKSIAIYEGHLSTIYGVGFGLQPDVIFSVSGDGTLRAWEMANQKILHIEWSKHGFQPVWGRAIAAWMLISGLLGLLCLWGLRKLHIWSHLLAVTLYLLGPLVVLGLPLFEVLSYPLSLGLKLQIAWPLIGLVAWYLALLAALLREPVALFYEAPQGASLAEQITTSHQTLKTRFGIFGLAVWIALLVILFSILRRFNLDIAFMGHYLEFIMGGAGLTVLVSAASIVLAIILALLGALGRLSRNPLANGVSSFYISLIRGTPLLVQIFIWYLGLPRLGLVLRPVVAGILALGVNYGAYMTEIFRAGIQAIGPGQHEAAAALGMSRGQTFRRIVLPQAFRIVIPPIGNEFIAMMKDSSLVSVMSVWELTYRAQKIGRQNFRNLETFLIAAAFYWLLTVVFQFLQGKLEEYMARSERR